MKSIITALLLSVALILPAMANPTTKPYVCSTRQNVAIRDFRTMQQVGELNKGECMEIDETVTSRNPEYMAVRGISGKLRLISKKFVVYKNTTNVRLSKNYDHLACQSLRNGMSLRQTALLIAGDIRQEVGEDELSNEQLGEVVKKILWKNAYCLPENYTSD
jgi:hypothetical protein